MKKLPMQYWRRALLHPAHGVLLEKRIQYLDALKKFDDEQSTGIEQVNLAITQMDQVTQQNAALVEQAAARAPAAALAGADNDWAEF